MQRREAQDQEIEQLRSRLAAEFDAGASRGSRESDRRCEALAEQLAEAQRRGSQCAAEAEAARAEAGRLAAARDSAEAALQAVQAELDAAKQLVVAQGDGDVFGDGPAVLGDPADVAAMGARLAELEDDNRQLAGQLAALQAGAGAHQAAAAGVDGQLTELQQVRRRAEVHSCGTVEPYSRWHLVFLGLAAERDRTRRLACQPQTSRPAYWLIYRQLARVAPTAPAAGERAPAGAAGAHGCGALPARLRGA